MSMVIYVKLKRMDLHKESSETIGTLAVTIISGGGVRRIISGVVNVSFCFPVSSLLNGDSGMKYD